MLTAIRFVLKYNEDDVDHVFDAFYDRFDGLIRTRDGITVATIETDAPCDSHPVIALVGELEAVTGARVQRIDDDLVDLSEVGLRLDRTKQNVHQIVSGTRGKGDFPEPYGHLGRIRMWRWADVADWARASGYPDNEPRGLDYTVQSAVNAWLGARNAVGGTWTAVTSISSTSRISLSAPDFSDELATERFSRSEVPAATRGSYLSEVAS